MALDPISAAKLSHGLGGFDVLMAATALEHNLPLYTFNMRHFRAIAGLNVLEPYVRQP
jgi:predicted nucleic acid-binding protein